MASDLAIGGGIKERYSRFALQQRLLESLPVGWKRLKPPRLRKYCILRLLTVSALNFDPRSVAARASRVTRLD